VGMDDPADQGGEAACWLDQMCAECGAVLEAGRPHRCEDRAATVVRRPGRSER
jgi:hypothetical protein